MSKANNLTDFLTDVADAIRYVNGKTEAINPQAFSDEIRDMKPADIVVNIQSETTLVGDDLKKVEEKQERLMQAVKNTTIDSEVVYKITSQQTSAQTIDTLFYTEEGDAAGYYYALNENDNYVSKLSLDYEVVADTTNETQLMLYNLLSKIKINGDKATSLVWNGSAWVISSASGQTGAIVSTGQCNQI